MKEKLINFLHHLVGNHNWQTNYRGDRPRWCRWANGQWQYRPMTEEEIIEDAWAQMR